MAYMFDEFKYELRTTGLSKGMNITDRRKATILFIQMPLELEKRQPIFCQLKFLSHSKQVRPHRLYDQREFFAVLWQQH